MMKNKEERWNKIIANYKPGNFVDGKVMKRMTFGVFVDIGELSNYTLGLIHLPQIKNLGYEIDDVMFDIGSNIKCEILDSHITDYLEIYLKP